MCNTTQPSCGTGRPLNHECHGRRSEGRVPRFALPSGRSAIPSLTMRGRLPPDHGGAFSRPISVGFYKERFSLAKGIGSTQTAVLGWIAMRPNSAGEENLAGMGKPSLGSHSEHSCTLRVNTSRQTKEEDWYQTSQQEERSHSCRCRSSHCHLPFF